MTEPDRGDGLPSPSAALLQLARLKAGLSQREFADRAGVPDTMISAYERDQRQPTLATLLRLLHAAGFDLRMHLTDHDPHDEVLASLEADRSDTQRIRRDQELQAWREAVPVGKVKVVIADLADVIRSKESAGRPKDLRVLPMLYRHLAEQRAQRGGEGSPAEQGLADG